MVCFDFLRNFFREAKLTIDQTRNTTNKGEAEYQVEVMESSDFGPILMAPFYPSFLLGGAAGAIDGDAGTGPTPPLPNPRHQERRPHI